jgi:hypothetical protein
MNSIKSKALCLGLGMFAFSAIYAQDTPKTPKPDTTQAPKHDSTTMVKYNHFTNAADQLATTSFLMINDTKSAAKKESMEKKKLS